MGQCCFRRTTSPKLHGKYTVKKSLYENADTQTHVVAVVDDAGKPCAIKIAPFDKAIQEYSFAKMLVHPCIARPREMFVRESTCLGDKRRLVGYIVQDLLAEDLLSFLNRRGKLPTHHVRVIASRIVSALQYMHTRKVVHRDVKLDNVMLAVPGDCASAKLIDFGLAEDVGAMQRGLRGTLTYMAPEMLAKWDTGVHIGPAVDMWALGILVYALALGTLPYVVHQRNGLSIIATFDFVKDSGWWTCDMHLKDFILRLLARDPKNRMSAAEASSHPFLQGPIEQ